MALYNMFIIIIKGGDVYVWSGNCRSIVAYRTNYAPQTRLIHL